MADMDGELLALAAAPTTRALAEDLSGRLGGEDPIALSEEALAEGELRAAVNFALSGALLGKPPPGELATRLVMVLENTDVAIALLGTVRDGLFGLQDGQPDFIPLDALYLCKIGHPVRADPDLFTGFGP